VHRKQLIQRQVAIEINNMENSASKTLLSFLAEEEKLSERRLRELTSLIESPNSFPAHILETLNLLKQNAEEDLSNILHIQSIFPSGLKKKANTIFSSHAAKISKPKQTVKAVQAVLGERGAVLGEVEDDIEAGVAATDDLFLLEGVDASSTQLRSPQSTFDASSTQLRSPQSTFSDEERDDSELDEGIHIPSKFSNRKNYEVAASLPVGIPWPAQMNNTSAAQTRTVAPVGEEKPRDIAASIQAMAKSVHTSSIFGDNTFGELPRPRLNTFSKD